MKKRWLRTFRFTPRAALWSVPLFLILGFWFYDLVPGYCESLGKPHKFLKATRTLKVLVIASPSFVTRFPTKWRGQAEKVIRNASKLLESEVGIKLIPGDYLPWAWGDHLAPDMLLAYPTGVHDIKVALTNDPLFVNDQTEQNGAGSGNTVAVSTHRSKKVALSIAHEVGHLFGAEHSARQGTLMSIEGNQAGSRIDPENWKIIIRSKYKDFKKDSAFRTPYLCFLYARTLWRTALA